jgi:hypothetical protein
MMQKIIKILVVLIGVLDLGLCHAQSKAPFTFFGQDLNYSIYTIKNPMSDKMLGKHDLEKHERQQHGN